MCRSVVPVHLRDANIGKTWVQQELGFTNGQREWLVVRILFTIIPVLQKHAMCINRMYHNRTAFFTHNYMEPIFGVTQRMLLLEYLC
jgi:hypothetical protein